MKPESRRGHLISPVKLDFTKAYETLALFKSGPPIHPYETMDGGTHNAMFSLDWDLSPFFPYINAVVPDVQMFDKPVYIKFLLEDRLCALHPRQGLFSPVDDLGDAAFFLQRLIHFFEDLNRRCDEIVPNFRKYTPVSPLDIYRLLPGTNCKACGYGTCIAFAAALSRQKTAADQCPHISPPMDETATYPLFDEQGNCIKTLSLNINSGELRRRIQQTEAQIRSLRARLEQYQRVQNERIAAANRNLPSPLTRREVEVLQHLAAGATNKTISRQLHISEHTVKSHVIHIFNKIGVNDRTQASVWAASQGLL